MPPYRLFASYQTAQNYAAMLYDIHGVIAGITRNGQTWKVG